MRGNPQASHRNVLRGLTAVVVALASLAAAAPAAASSLYDGPGFRPGPDLLYAKPKTAPQLTNHGIWKAKPILVSGASAYRRGEFLYQDFLFDDHGAQGTGYDPNDPRTTANNFSKPNGTYTYPTDRVYAGNAADLVEFRVKPMEGYTAFRLTLNTLKDPNLTATTIALGSPKAKPREVPFGANTTAPARRFLTIHGDQAVLQRSRKSGLKELTPAPEVKVSKKRRQIEIRVSKQAWNPGRRTIRFGVGTGLWDPGTDSYVIPGETASATMPGGAVGLTNPSAFFNLAFRYHEPVSVASDPAQVAQEPAWWRDALQADALTAGEMEPMTQKVDFGKLHDGVTNNRHIPKKGPIDRILSSRFEPAQGTDFSVQCLLSSSDCPGPYQSRLQPYGLYVPKKPQPARGYGFTYLLHSLATNYNQYTGSNHQRQFGERGDGFIVATPEARGPDGFYANLALADTFEVWADVAAHYDLDPGHTAIAGYSMGGIGTFKIAEMFPDLFAKAQPVVGDSDDNEMVASLRNIPVLMWNGLADELVGPSSYLPTASALDDLGYRYELDVYDPGEHLSLAINDEFTPAADFLGGALLRRDPAHVTFVRNPGFDHPEFDLVADHAYWIDAVKAAGAGSGTVDAISHGFGEGDPPVSAQQNGAGALPGGALLDPYPFSRQYRTWGEVPATAVEDRIELTATGISSLRIDPERAAVDCDVAVEGTTDTPLTVKLAGCGRTVHLAP